MNTIDFNDPLADVKWYMHELLKVKVDLLALNHKYSCEDPIFRLDYIDLYTMNKLIVRQAGLLELLNDSIVQYQNPPKKKSFWKNLFRK